VNFREKKSGITRLPKVSYNLENFLTPFDRNYEFESEFQADSIDLSSQAGMGKKGVELSSAAVYLHVYLVRELNMTR